MANIIDRKKRVVLSVRCVRETDSMTWCSLKYTNNYSCNIVFMRTYLLFTWININLYVWCILIDNVWCTDWCSSQLENGIDIGNTEFTRGTFKLTSGDVRWLGCISKRVGCVCCLCVWCRWAEWYWYTTVEKAWQTNWAVQSELNVAVTKEAGSHWLSLLNNFALRWRDLSTQPRQASPVLSV